MANVALTHFAQTLRVVSLALARPVTLEIHTLIATTLTNVLIEALAAERLPAKMRPAPSIANVSTDHPSMLQQDLVEVPWLVPTTNNVRATRSVKTATAIAQNRTSDQTAKILVTPPPASPMLNASFRTAGRCADVCPDSNCCRFNAPASTSTSARPRPAASAPSAKTLSEPSNANVRPERAETRPENVL
jgi:hypothetical protein